MQQLSLKQLFSPYFVGLLIGISALALTTAGGQDASNFYTKSYTEFSNTLPWVHLVTGPLGLAGWPYSWLLLNLLTLLVIRFALLVWHNRWWVTILSFPVFWTLWLGQIEMFPIAGAAIGWLAIERKLHPLWMILAFMLMGTKVQATGGLSLFYLWKLYESYGWRTLVQVLLGGIAVGAVTLMIWWEWPIWWINRLTVVVPEVNDITKLNSSIVPFGLITVPLAFLPFNFGKLRRARIIVSVTLLASPYFAGYHTVLLLAMSSSPIISGISWLPMIPMLTGYGRSFGWLIPLGVIIYELITFWLERHSDSVSDTESSTKD